MNYHIVAAKQEPYKKAYLAKKQTIVMRIFWEKGLKKKEEEKKEDH